MYNPDYVKQYNAMQDYIYTTANRRQYDPYLMHYGVPGMKWGQHLFGKLTSLGSTRKAVKETRSGKRLTSRSKSFASRVKRRMEIQQGKKIADAEKTLGIRDDSGAKTSKDKQKARVLKSRSAKELYKHADLFSDEELNKAYNRLALEKRISELEPKQKSVVDKWVEGTQNAVKISNNAQQIAGNGIKFYNYMADVYNGTHSSSKLTKFGSGDDKGDDKKDTGK